MREMIHNKEFIYLFSLPSPKFNKIIRILISFNLQKKKNVSQSSETFHQRQCRPSSHVLLLTVSSRTSSAHNYINVDSLIFFYYMET